jgi:hypothetical protein
MATRNVTPVLRGIDKPSVVAAADAEARDNAERALTQARAIVDLLQGAAAHAAIEPPSNGESLACTLGVVLELLDTAHSGIWPEGVRP